MEILEHPFPEVALPKAPLVLALCQIRYPADPALESDEVAQRLHARLKALFPVKRPEPQEALTVGFGPDGPTQQRVAGTMWKFETIDKSWWVSFTRDFAALSTVAYESRDDFLERLAVVVQALADETGIVVYDRVGMRYIDVVDNQDVIARLDRHVRPELLGTAALEDAREAVALVHSITDSIVQVGDAQVRVRSGIVPPNAQIEPGVPPADERAWFLDIDAFEERTSAFTTSSVVAQARSLAGMGYQMFRWATTDDFIEFYGGKP